jgi:hypothetical protein
MRLFDGFAGKLGWSMAFLARGWTVTTVDLVAPSEIPDGVEFIQRDMLEIDAGFLSQFDFACCSSPCEQFALFGLKHFHPNPPYPELGIKLFNHSRAICEAAGIPYVLENVRAAQQFIGTATHHGGPYFLWGSGVPPLMPQGLQKRFTSTATEYRKARALGQEAVNEMRKRYPHSYSGSGSKLRASETARAATIPFELANAVADYAERTLEQRRCA